MFTSDIELDARVPIEEVHKKWRGCERCELGIHRNAVDGKQTFGEGIGGGILFVSEGPDEYEEKTGVTMSSAVGEYIRSILAKTGTMDYYFLPVVACRCCEVATDQNGKPMFRKNRRTGLEEPIWRNVPPAKRFVQECYDRFLEELYLADPVVIVTMGPTATEVLLPATRVTYGESYPAKIMGASWRMSLTDKLNKWARKYDDRGTPINMPIVRNTVRYTVIPTYDPAFIVRKLNRSEDEVKSSRSNPEADSFEKHVKTAVDTYDLYHQIAKGKPPSKHEVENV